MKAELRRLRLVEGRAIALARMKAYKPGQPGERTFTTAEELAEAMGLRGQPGRQVPRQRVVSD